MLPPFLSRPRIDPAEDPETLLLSYHRSSSCVSMVAGIVPPSRRLLPLSANSTQIFQEKRQKHPDEKAEGPSYGHIQGGLGFGSLFCWHSPV